MIFVSLGNELGFSIPPLQTEAALGHFDAVLHVGDMAYDLAQDNARQVEHEVYLKAFMRGKKHEKGVFDHRSTFCFATLSTIMSTTWFVAD